MVKAETENLSDLIGVDVEIPGEEGLERGWISELSREPGKVMVTLYRDNREVHLRPEEITESSLYGPELPVLSGFQAIDWATPDGEPFCSLRIAADRFRLIEQAAAEAGEEIDEFLIEAIRLAVERELAGDSDS